MKRFTLITIALTFLQISFAQNSTFKNSWRTEYGYAFTGVGDLDGYSLYNEYARKITNQIKIAPGFGIMHFNQLRGSGFDGTHSLLQVTSARTVGLTAYYTPQLFNAVALEIGVGGFYRNWKRLYATGPNTSFYTDEVVLGPSEYAQLNSNVVGATGSMGLQISLTERFALNLRGVYQIDSDSGNAISARLGLNVDF